MNILYICPRFPYPPDQGDKVVIYNQIKFLSKRNKITLLAMIENEKELDGLPNLSCYCSRIETFKRRPNFSIQNFITAVYRIDPFNVIRYYLSDMFKCSKRLIESGEFDIVHVAFYYMAQYVINKNIKIPKKTATILDTHNVEYLIYSRYALLTKNPFVILDSFRIKKYELSIYKRFDKCITFSELDRNNIIKLSGASNIVVNPSCIEITSAYQRSPLSEEGTNTLLYFGRLNTLANDNAIKFFYKKIFPLVKKEVPDVKFIIAGKFPSKYVTNLIKDSSIRLVGLVPDIREFLKKVALVIVPLRLGGGIRVKILESWAAGKAVVSTSVGAEGVDVRDGVDIVIANSISDFAKEITILLKDREKRERLGHAGFEKVYKYYNPNMIIENLEKIYRKTLEEKLLRNG